MNTTDHRPAPEPFDVLVAARPTDSSLDTVWTDARSALALAQLSRLAETGPPTSRLVVPTPRRRRPRRWVALGAAAAVTAVALSIGPSILSDGGGESAAAVSQLVTSARRSSPAIIPQGSFLHRVVVEAQTATDPSTSSSAATLESWTASDGQIWRRDTSEGKQEVSLFPPMNDGPIDFSPSGAAQLPTDADALRELLDSRVSGSSSHDEAMFVALGDVLRMGYVPPATRAAAIEVAAGLPEVSVRRDPQTTTLSFVDEARRAGVTQSLVFDTTTAALTQERTTSRVDGTEFTSTTTTSEVVARVPAEVVRAVRDPAKVATPSG